MPLARCGVEVIGTVGLPPREEATIGPQQSAQWIGVVGPDGAYLGQDRPSLGPCYGSVKPHVKERRPRVGRALVLSSTQARVRSWLSAVGRGDGG